MTVKYPIFSINIQWVENQDTTTNCSNFLPHGCLHNHLDFYKMFKQEIDIQSFAEDWFIKYREKHDPNDSWTHIKIEAKLDHHESWCLHHFSHYTFDDGCNGRTDEEYYKSFEAYVQRMEEKNKNEKVWERFPEVDGGYWKNPVHLMNAEDRWRWRGETEEDKDVVCRCEKCKNHGIVTIKH